MRIFLALNLPNEIRKVISGAIKPLADLTTIKLVEEDNLHITISFLGELTRNELNNLLELLPGLTKNFKPFKVTINNIIFLPKRDFPHVLALSLKDNNKVQRLHQAIQDKINELKLKPQGWKNFLPHITLGRIKDQGWQIDNKLIETINRKIPNQDIAVNSIDVMESRLQPKGPKYEIIKSLTLESQRSD